MYVGYRSLIFVLHFGALFLCHTQLPLQILQRMAGSPRQVYYNAGQVQHLMPHHASWLPSLSFLPLSCPCPLRLGARLVGPGKAVDVLLGLPGRGFRVAQAVDLPLQSNW